MPIVIPSVTKTDLRREMRRRLREEAENGPEHSRAIVAAITSSPMWENVNTLALFSALPGEPDLAPLWEKGQKRFCYPRVEEDGMRFFEIRTLAELLASQWHPKVLEPVGDSARLVAAEEIDLILVPGLAFTRDGHRTGRGGGFYDRYLEHTPASTFKLGVCFECQIVPELPWEAHDQMMDGVVTEQGLAERQ